MDVVHSVDIVQSVDVIESVGGTSTIEIIRNESVIDEQGTVSYFLEVLREKATPLETSRDTQLLESVMPGGTVVNVGIGPDLPENPYEGQVWIKT